MREPNEQEDAALRAATRKAREGLQEIADIAKRHVGAIIEIEGEGVITILFHPPVCSDRPTDALDKPGDTPILDAFKGLFGDAP